MAVLIKDMNFPDLCRNCEIENTHADAWVDITHYECPLLGAPTDEVRRNGRHPLCPLISISEVSADKLLQEIRYD